MPAGPQEALPQAAFVLRLRYAIDTARNYPTAKNIAAAREFAESQPVALRSTHARHNLGGYRWQWLIDQGIIPVGEGGEIEGSFKATITPDKLG